MENLNPNDEPKVVKTLYHYSASPEQIAKFYRCDVETIIDILGLNNLNKKEIDRIHREKNFFEHGRSEEVTFNIRMEHYGLFLHEGDFEFYQPFCYMSHWNPFFWIFKLRVNLIRDSKDPVKQRRKNWLVMRFLKYQGEKWSRLEEQNIELNKLL